MKTHLKIPQDKGFALIVTLSLMILLTIIAVGLLTLSTVSLRSAGQGNAISIARNNARLAMMLALGDLQKTLGPDQGVSAPAASVIKDAKRPHLLGAWQSWHWTPTPGGAPPYSDKQNLFRGWLVSSATPANAKQLGLAAGADPTGTNAVNLVGDATAPLTDGQGKTVRVMAEKIKVGSTAQPGKLAWAAFDESTKAAVDLGDPKTAQTSGEEIASRTAPNRFRADALDTKLNSLETPEKLISLETASVPAGANAPEIRRRFHDFTTGSVGLLTDTAKGGLKTDLTPLFEASTLPANAFVAPTNVSPYDTSAFPLTSGAPRWAYLRDHYRKYKTVKTASSEPTYAPSASTDLKVKIANPQSQTGVEPAPDAERLIPVIAKFQLVFSMVAHYPFIAADSNRQKVLDDKGDPKGYKNYGVPDLVYDPVITLYNPYDVTLNLSKIRIRVWDPPVGFSFTKKDNKAGTTANFRADSAFVGLADMHFNAQPNDRKCFTLVLADGTSSGLINSTNGLKLKPGEVKVFSPRVESSWTWSTETAGGYGSNTQATFFDWDPSKYFGNLDHRASASIGKTYGVECAPGWDTVAGLQTDNLANNRNPASVYPFEPPNCFVTIRTTDEVWVDAKPLVVPSGAAAQFQVDVLAAGPNPGSSSPNSDPNNLGVVSDTLRSYRFNFSGISDELSKDPSNPVIHRECLISQILQPDGPNHKAMLGYKKPFAMLEMSARTTKGDLTDSKPWLYNNFVVEGGVQDSSMAGLTHQAYDLRFIEMSAFDSFPKGIDIDPDTKRGYFGAYGSIAEGSSFVNMLHVPLAPAASLGDLIATNLVSSSVLPRVVHPFGNSRAHPLIPSGSVSSGTTLDHSYLLNDALWDSYFFSSLTNYGGSTGGVMPTSKPLKSVLAGVFDGTEPALNSRLVPATIPGDSQALADTLAARPDLDRSKQIAKYVAVSGPFNVNSTSVDAWRAVLSSLRDRTVNGLDGAKALTVKYAPNPASLATTSSSNSTKTPFVRAGKPLADSVPQAGLFWAGYRALTDPQIEELAKLIVAEITASGVQDGAPCLSLGEFVNRRPGSSSDLHSLAGLLQTAIDKSTINDDSKARDSKTLSASTISAKRKQGVQTEDVLNGYSAEGTPSMLTQGDLMSALAPIATVRGDTFKIRSYGEALAASGNTILARAWCEVVVQRLPDFLDPADAPETAVTSLTSNTNKIFGRRFNIVSFRWLDEKEI
jgi:hypothetical protein